jgi:hypothetical protein
MVPERSLDAPGADNGARAAARCVLIAQAQQEGLTLVTADTRIHAYDVAVLDPLA